MSFLKDSNTVLLVVLGAIVIGAGGFFLGRHAWVGFGKQWANGNVPMMAGARFGTRGHMFGGRHGMMGGYGEITKIEGNTVTLNIGDDTTKEVTLSGDAVVNLMTKGTTKDLQVGQTIMMMGGGFWNGTETVVVQPQ